ncbi:MAG: hypothetical protein M3552_13055 [Planctomycetota bacterium]|nr:hypothetical protein [Planctomycetaceae bacterium]MDQ3331561.1 hypothetical protein [Planctomycetota bacterium]
MNQAPQFNEALEAVEQLPAQAQAELIEIVRRRLAEQGRERLHEEVRQARDEFAAGGCSPASPDELLGEILS